MKFLVFILLLLILYVLSLIQQFYPKILKQTKKPIKEKSSFINKYIDYMKKNRIYFAILIKHIKPYNRIINY